MGDTFYEYTNCKGGGKGGLTTQLVGKEIPVVRGGGKAALTTKLIGQDILSAKGAGKARQSEGLRYTETVTAKGGARLTEMATRLRMVLSCQARGAGRGSDTERFLPQDISRVRAAGRSALTTQSLATLQSVVRAAGRSAFAVSKQISTESLSAKGAGRAALSTQARVSDRLSAKGAGRTALTDQRKSVDTPTAKGGGKSALTTKLIGQDRPTVRGAGKIGGTHIVNYASDLLMRHLRINVKTLLPEVTCVPEALVEAEFGDDGEMNFPFLALIAQTPRPDLGWAVNDIPQIIPVDFVYVRKFAGDGDTDSHADARNRLVTLIAGLMQDPHQKAGTTESACQMTSLVATSIDRLNHYQMEMVDLSEVSTVVMMTTLEFVVIGERVV